MSMERGPCQQRPRRSGSVMVRAGHDLYRILGVPCDASKHMIKTAYRRLARRTHPDVCKEADAEERFKEISEAYEVCSP
jgi:DnaJ-class molecular chaperone